MLRVYAYWRSHIFSVPLEGSNNPFFRKTSRNTIWTTSSASASSFPRVSCCKRSLSEAFWSSLHSRRRAPLRVTASLIDGLLPNEAQCTKLIHLSRCIPILEFRERPARSSAEEQRENQGFDRRSRALLRIASTWRDPLLDA